MRYATAVRRSGLAVCAGVMLSCASDVRETAPAGLPLVRLEASDFAFSVPAQVANGPTRVRLVNHGPSWHEALITRLPEGITAEDYLKEARAGAAFPVDALDLGGPGKVAAGDSSEVTLVLEPGNYAVVCWADAHVKAGMLSAISVAGDNSTSAHGGARQRGAEASPQGTPTGEIRLEDFRIVHDSMTYHRGTNVLRVRNTGRRPHDLTYYRLAEGKSVRDFGTWYATREGPAPAVPVGGTSTLAPGREGLVNLELPPGRYFAGCGTPEEGPDGVTLHSQMGMVEVFEIR